MTFSRLLNHCLVFLVCAGCSALEPGPLIAAGDIKRAMTKFESPPEGPRYLAFISDLHMGLGRQDEGPWHPTEDFRWPNALGGFLEEIDSLGNGAVDLVIVGDFLELWQLPEHIKCEGLDADLGCTADEMAELAGIIVTAHIAEFEHLRQFSQSGENRLHIIPGNHDATLLLANVWAPVAEALDAVSGRINLVADGVWLSDDGRILVEHGHQIGSDVNRYKDWPSIAQNVDDEVYVIRPWGERFVQELFNADEATYPVIDNLSPEAAGARFRMADRGLGGSVVDIARFIAFNLWETSGSQMISFLGRDDSESDPEWKVQEARKAGHKLFTSALPEDDPLRALILANSQEAAALRTELDALALDESRLPDQDVKSLCDQNAMRGILEHCQIVTLGASLEKILFSREAVLRAHLKDRLKTNKSVRIFIYGHTHKLETLWLLDINSLLKVRVLNTGAFQRLVGEEAFLERTRSKNITPGEGLRKFDLEGLAPCYTTVLVPPAAGALPKPKVKQWFMPEGSHGRFLSPGDARCR